MDGVKNFFPTDTHNSGSLNLRGRLLDLSTPKIMGVLNFTPDSFYAGSRLQVDDGLEVRIREMVAEGMAILDIGACSTRPGAIPVAETTEATIIREALEFIRDKFPDLPVSVDTWRAEVAQLALQSGAAMINDVTAGNGSEAMLEVIREFQVPIVLMHSRGNSETMQSLTQYDHLITDVLFELSVQVNKFVRAGVHDLVIDPGFGFAKTREQNLELLMYLDQLKTFGFPVLAGVSRKSMIWRTLGISPEESLNGTTVFNTMALERGASLLRVHDVKPAAEAIELYVQARKYY